MSNTTVRTKTSADNVLRLVRLLHEDGRLRVVDAADRLRVARSTAHRLLSTLRQHDFATQDRRRVYRPGPALTLLGAGRTSPDLPAVAHRHLQALATRTGETAHLMALEGNGVRFLDGVEGTGALRVGIRIGLLLPAHTTSGGKALLAELPGEELRRLYPRGLPRSDPPAIGDLTDLRRALAAVRRRGYATNVEESGPGISAVGLCVRDTTGRAVAALAVAAPSARCPRRRWPELTGHLRAAAVAIGADLDRCAPARPGAPAPGRPDLAGPGAAGRATGRSAGRAAAPGEPVCGRGGFRAGPGRMRRPPRR